MANEIFKNLKTRIALKQNTYDYWVNGEGKDYIPLYGEVCLCEIPAPEADVTTQTNGSQEATNAPTVLFKVGTGKKDDDGNWVTGTNKTFAQLNWVSALAADVYGWAKAPTKPSYGAEEITGIGEYIAKYVDEELGISVDTNTVYQIVKVDDLNYKLQSKAAGTDAWADVEGSVITIPESTKVEASEQNGYIKVDDEEVQVYKHPDKHSIADVDGLQDALDGKQAVIPEGTYDAYGSAAQALTDAKAYVDEEDVFHTDITTVNALGGIAAGADLDGMTTHEILNTLLFPYVAFTLGSTSRSAAAATLENGATQTLSSASISITKKSKPITSVKLLNGSTILGEKTGDEVAAGGTITFSNLGITVSKSNNPNLKFTVTDGKTSTDKNVGASTFVYPYYMGSCAADATIDEALVEGLTKKVESRGNKTVTYDCAQERMVIAYPKAHGVLKSIIDPNNFETIDGYTRSEVTVTGLDGTAQVYYVYASAPCTASGFKVQFKY